MLKIEPIASRDKSTGCSPSKSPLTDELSMKFISFYPERAPMARAKNTHLVYKNFFTKISFVFMWICV